MFQLVETLATQMSASFPELAAQKDLITKVIHEEEASFLRTLETGIKLLEGHIGVAKKNNRNEISGKEAFTLYDTYGFPLDLTELICREQGLSVNRTEFDKEMISQKERSRSDAAVETLDWVEVAPIPSTQFVGYDTTEAQVHIARYRSVKSKGAVQFHLVLDATPFYAESGGQVGDSGQLTSGSETISIVNTIKENNLTVHVANKLPANPKETFVAQVDMKRRLDTANNHTATHLLHFALRQVLGTHVEQKGSLVHPDYLRFDFSHFQKMTDAEIRQVERTVNAAIRANTSAVEFRDIPMDEAKAMGAISLFGEKYGDSVRVMQFGDSLELCGGTHVEQTGTIGIFKVLSEGAISAGVRRIEAITGTKAEEYLYEQTDTISELRETLGATGKLLPALEKVLNDNKHLKKELEEAELRRGMQLKNQLKSSAIIRGGATIIVSKVEPLGAETLKTLAFQLRNEVENLFLALGTESQGKAQLTIALSDSLVKERGLNASAIVREAAKEIQGGGGGQPFYATAGGKNPAGLENALAKAIEIAQL